MKKKGQRHLIKFVSSKNTGVFYISEKNKQSTQKKINIKKYDMKLRKHVLFYEKKLI